MSAAPYEPVSADGLFRRLNGELAAMTDVVTRGNPRRYEAEVKLLQLALGAEPDGIIGPATRAAALAAYRRRISNQQAAEITS